MNQFLKIQRLSLLALFTVVCLFVGCSAEAKRARHYKRAEAYFQKGEYIKAELEYRNVARLSKNVDPKLAARIATIYYEQGRVLEGLPFLTNAVAMNPADLELRYRLGTVFATLRQFKEARESALFVLTNRPDHAEAMLLLVDAARNPDETKIVRQQINQIVSTSGDRWSAHVALAELAFREKQTNAAEKEIQLAAKLNSTNPHVNIALAKLSAVRNDSAATEKFLRIASEHSPRRSPHRLLLPQYKIDHTNIAEAKALLDKMIKEAPDYVPAATLRGRVALAEKDFTESARIAKSVLAWDPFNYDIRLLNARTLVLQGKSTNAIVEFERLLSLYPRVPELHYEAAIAQVQNGAADAAVKQLDEALRLAPEYSEAVVLRAELKQRTGSPQEAVDSLFAFTRKRPDAARARLSLANAYAASGKPNEALAIYREFMRSDPLVPEFPFFAGAILLQQKKSDEARPLFEQALKLSPSYLQAAEQIVDIDLAKRDFPAAQRRVDEQLRLTTNAAGALMLQAKVCMARQDWPGAESALTSVLKAVPDAMLPYSLLAQVYLFSGDSKKAVAQLRSAAERNPNDTTALMLLGVIHEAQKDYDSAKKAYEDVLKLSPNMAAALNNLAYILCENLNQVDQALPYATKAHELAPNDHGVTDTLGWIFYRRGEFARALPLLLESAEKLPQQAEVQYHLAMVNYATGNETAARTGFARVIELDKPLAEAKGVSRRLTVLNLDPASPNAADMLETSLKADGNDFLVALKLGRAYESAGANEKAQSAFERATKLAPGSAQPLILLASLNADKLNDVQKALEAGRNARKLSPNDPAIAGVLGRVSYRANDYPAALTLLQEYSRSDKADTEALYDLALAGYSVGQIDEARSNLDNYAKAARGKRVAEARNVILLMDFYLGKGDPRQAETIASGRLQRNSNDIPALVTLGLVAERGGKYFDAVQHFERIVTLNKNFPVAQRQLAILYAEHLQNDQKAYEFGSKARQTYSNDPDLAIALGKASYRRNDFPSAARFLREGVRQRQSDPEAFYYLGMAYHKTGNASDAKTELNHAVAAKLDPKLAAEAKKVLASFK